MLICRTKLRPAPCRAAIAFGLAQAIGYIAKQETCTLMLINHSALRHTSVKFSCMTGLRRKTRKSNQAIKRKRGVFPLPVCMIARLPMGWRGEGRLS